VDGGTKIGTRIKPFKETEPRLIHEFGLPPRRTGRLAKGEDKSSKTEGNYW
jgi:hypothetical protein